jgi:hypothetical protein
MTLQELLTSQPQAAKLTKLTKLSELDKEKQKAKTATLLAANKAAASRILLGALAQLESNSSISKEVEKQIWI